MEEVKGSIPFSSTETPGQKAWGVVIEPSVGFVTVGSATSLANRVRADSAQLGGDGFMQYLTVWGG